MTQLSFWGYDDAGIAATAGRRLVYFVACGEFVKIGFTTRDIRERIGELETGNPSPLELLGTLFVTKDQDDRNLHSQFARFHYRNEWFHRTPDLLTAIAALVQRNERLIPWTDINLERPCYIVFRCPTCDRSPLRPIEILGENQPGAVLGTTVCATCEIAFVLRVRTDGGW